MSLDSECIDLKISDTVMTSQERNKFRARRSKRVCGGVIEWKSTHLGT